MSKLQLVLPSMKGVKKTIFSNFAKNKTLFSQVKTA